MKSISAARITLNPDKCALRKSEIKFWGLIFSKDGTKAAHDKVNIFQNSSRSKTKNELISFICMMQPNADFIPNFTKEAAALKELIKSNTKYEWLGRQQHSKDKHSKAYLN